MKTSTYTYTLILFLLVSACGNTASDNSENTSEETQGGSVEKQEEKTSEKEGVDPYADWQSNDGIGSIVAFTLPDEINQAMADKGKVVFEAKCTACHKTDKKFIGPSPQNIFERRTPAWIMNMILDPETMIQEDPIAKQLLIDYNGAPMANQNLEEEEARSVLEYFRTLTTE